MCCFWLEWSACIFADEYTNIFRHKGGEIYRSIAGILSFNRQNRKHDPHRTSTHKRRVAPLKPAKSHWDKQKKKKKKIKSRLGLAENWPIWKEQVNSVFLDKSQHSLDDADLSVHELHWFLCLVTWGHTTELRGSAEALHAFSPWWR